MQLRDTTQRSSSRNLFSTPWCTELLFGVLRCFLPGVYYVFVARARRSILPQLAGAFKGHCTAITTGPQDQLTYLSDNFCSAAQFIAHKWRCQIKLSFRHCTVLSVHICRYFRIMSRLIVEKETSWAMANHISQLWSKSTVVASPQIHSGTKSEAADELFTYTMADRNTTVPSFSWSLTFFPFQFSPLQIHCLLYNTLHGINSTINPLLIFCSVFVCTVCKLLMTNFQFDMIGNTAAFNYLPPRFCPTVIFPTKKRDHLLLYR